MLSRRRANLHKRSVSELDLRPGDVFLSHGGRRKSDFICLIDGGDYSHASLWDGTDVVEATGSVLKVHRCKLRELIDHTKYVDAFRPMWGGQPLGTDGLPPEPLLRVAHAYIDQRYSYGQVYLIGTLLAAGRLLGHPSGQEVFNQIANELAVALKKAEGLGPDDQPMVCSHYVSRCFWEADSSHARRYGLRAWLQPNGFWRDPESAPAEDRSEPGDELPEWSAEDRRAHDKLRADCRRILLGDPSPLLPDPKVERDESDRLFRVKHREVIAGSVELPVVSVTPGHLQHSPTLEYLGVVSEPPRDQAWLSADDVL